MVATISLDELQVTASVMSTVVPSSKVPMAVNCLVWPELIEALVGLIAIDRKLARVTITLVDPLIAADVAVTLTVPAPTAVTRPASETVATALSSEDQLTDPVMFLVLPSSYVPVAVICLVLLSCTSDRNRRCRGCNRNARQCWVYKKTLTARETNGHQDEQWEWQK